MAGAIDIKATILRYKLDPGEIGVLRSATPNQSTPLVTGQELGNLRQFTREAATRGDVVVLSNVEYKTDIVDGRLSIRAGRTEVYSVPRGTRPNPPAEKPPDVERKPAEALERRDREPERTEGAREPLLRERASEAPTRPEQEDNRRAEVRRLRDLVSMMKTRLEARESERREEARSERFDALSREGAAREVGRRESEEFSVEPGGGAPETQERATATESALFEKEIRELNRRIAMVESQRLIEANNRMLEVAIANLEAGIAGARAPGLVSIASGRLNAVV